ncbi:MAG: hypothetical protein ABJN98_21265, partial [Roseibium sp.]
MYSLNSSLVMRPLSTSAFFSRSMNSANINIAMPIEAWFGHFEQQFLKTCPGYIGDDRMNPKRPAPGKLPTPFTGDFNAFKRVF